MEKSNFVKQLRSILFMDMPHLIQLSHNWWTFHVKFFPVIFLLFPPFSSPPPPLLKERVTKMGFPGQEKF